MLNARIGKVYMPSVIHRRTTLQGLCDPEVVNNFLRRREASRKYFGLVTVE